MIRVTTLSVLLAAAWLAPAQDFKDLEKKVSDFTMANGFRFLVIDRRDSPSITFVTHVVAGSANDPAGSSGLAKLFERLAMTGTETVGTRDAAAEKKAMDAVEQAYDRLEAERAKGRRADEIQTLRLQLEVQKAMSAAQSFIVENDFRRALAENGAGAIAAAVSADRSEFTLTLASHRAELWFFLESQRLSRPVFRGFYRERDAAVPEHRAAVEFNARTKLLQTLCAAAFSADPYRNPVFGWPAEFAELRESDARRFFHRYYTPANITFAVAGDIRAEDAKRLAERYFGAIPARPLPPGIRSAEPAQTGPRTVVIENAAEPMFAMGFKRPDAFDRDDPVLDVIQMILGGGKSSWLVKELVETRGSASSVQAIASYPAASRPHLFTILATVAAGHTAEENEKAAGSVLERLQTETVDEATLDRARASARANLVRRFDDNASIAATLAIFAATHGDWRQAFAAADARRKVTAEQVKTAAARWFVPSRRTAVLMTAPAPRVVDAAKGDGR